MMGIRNKMVLFGPIILLCMSCGQSNVLAPVEESTWTAFSINQKSYKVRKGDTLYAVAFSYDKDYRQLAAINHLKSPYALRIGQLLSLQTPQKAIKTEARQSFPQAAKKMFVRKTAPQKRQTNPWVWPAQGQLASSFIPQQGKKGINIAGKKGDKIKASASGVVAYAGNGLSGYGNLLIIKHQNNYLTAYGNNAKNLVKEGQKVERGQVIADMGQVDRKYWGVHFEIRKFGKPVNPLNYLQKVG